ncbi:MAG: GGDEF domain-containing protein [Prochloraceae cyanobacterium]|nr:GGDEF domain-containing protein [Prochloraceae cyanobacterium]
MHLESTVQELDLYYFQIDVSESVSRITSRFKFNPDLPGVILKENNKFVGMISQKNYWKYMSLPYSLDLAAKRSAKYLCELIDIENLIVSRNTLIVEAVQKSLERPAKLLEEPIVVKFSPRTYKLVDIHQLLVAYAKIYQSATKLIHNMYKELEESNKKLEDVSRLDTITNLVNRRIFEDFLKKNWKISVDKKRKILIYLIMFEIDCFKEYNDIYGYIEGDKCLRKIADIISSYLANTGDFAARYGGCKLAIVLCNKSGIQASAMAQNIREEIKELNLVNPSSQGKNCVTVSCGIAGMIPSFSNSPNTLIRATEQALDRAKKLGGNRQIMWNNSSATTHVV